MLNTKTWSPKQFDNEKVKRLLNSSSDITEPTAKLLVSIGIETPEQVDSFLNPDFRTGLHNPGYLQEIKPVLERIKQALDNDESILIHGDYDADGITTGAIFVKAFDMLGKKVDYFLPNRFTDGYGINVNNAEKFSKYDLIISGDTGIKAYEAAYEITHTYKKDLIVTDHHEPVVFPISERHRIPEKTRVIENETHVMALPDCYATINPKRIDDVYPSKDLSGAGVAFKVMEALFMYLKKPRKSLYILADFVACGLIPDMVPLFDAKRNSFEVRNFVKLGLNLMNNNPKNWVTAVKDITKNTRTLTSTDLGFGYGPLLNAVGRLYDPTPGLEFLLEEDEDKLKEQVAYLHEVNLERRKLSKETGDKIIESLKSLPKEYVDYGIVVNSSELHIGITGLVAGDILKEYYRPTIALAEFNDSEGKTIYRGSARSIEGISVLEALIDVEAEIGYYIYGGHEQAAGVTLYPEQVEPFRKAFREACKKQAIEQGEEKVFEPKEFYDLELHFQDISIAFIEELNRFEPYGMGNPEPIFYVNNVSVENVLSTKNDNCKRFELTQNGVSLTGIAFNKGKKIQKEYDELVLELVMKFRKERADELAELSDDEQAKSKIIKEIENNVKANCIEAEILFTPQINEWRGEKKVQIVVKDIIFKPSL